ncbi:O-antigen ligase domain-containing protein [Candidatus Microgenomates bacterium]|nr:MAG: O-antigen ligase domain-containing protein [Candidatus Microgenomates bacterium]
MQKHSKLYKLVFKYLVLALLLFVPLYPKFPLYAIGGVQVSIRLEDLLLFLVFVVWLAITMFRKFDLLRTKVSLSFLVFFLIGGLSLFSAITITQTVAPQLGLLHLMRRAEYMLCFLFGWEAVRDRAHLPLFMRSLVVVVFVVFIVGLGQKYFGWPVITTQNSEYAKGVALSYKEGGHLVSTFAGHYDMANYLVFVSPLLLAFMLAKKQVIQKVFGDKVYVSRIVLLVSLLASYWLIVNAASRIPIVSFIIASSALLVFMGKKRLIPAVIVVSVIMTGLSSNLVARYMNIFNVAVDKVVSQVEEMIVHPVYAQALEDRSTSIRTNVEWPRAIRAFSKNPLLGTGYSSISLATDNDYLRMLGEVGVLGFVAFLLLCMQICVTLFSNIKIPLQSSYSYEQLFTVCVLASLPAVLLNMLFIDILEASKFAISFWLILGFAFGINYAKKN